MDGVPGITNQYLFQPIAGAFYSPVRGRRPRHLGVRPRVHARDLQPHGRRPGRQPDRRCRRARWARAGPTRSRSSTSRARLRPARRREPWAEGPYVTGNKKTGIRDYALDDNPLNYSDVGFDITGPEVHADGEIWNAVDYDIRQALVKKYDAQFPSTDRALQLRCADGRPGTTAPRGAAAARAVPGQPALDPDHVRRVPAPAGRHEHADRARRLPGRRPDALRRRQPGASCGPRSPSAAWAQSASTDTNEDDQPKPGFDSPLAEQRHGHVRHHGLRQAAVPATIYIGRYEARATPARRHRSVDRARRRRSKLVPGTYDVLVRAAGYGLRRFSSPSPPARR